MEYKRYFKFITVFLLFTILFSCGTMSRGSFEKRKHLKGWHFKKNKKFTLSGLQRKDKEIIRYESVGPIEEENELALSVNNGQKDVIKVINDSITQRNLKKKENENTVFKTLELEENNNLPSIDETNSDLLKSNSKNNFLSRKVENYKIIANNSTHDENVEEKSKRYFHPLIIALGIIVYTYLLLLGLSIALLLGFIPAALGGWFGLGIPIWFICGYVVFAFYIYYISDLFEREDGSGSLSIKEAFKKALFVYFVFLGVSAAFLINLI